MCGIAGLIWRHKADGNTARGRAIISDVLRSMQHRGPDGQGIEADNAMALGHLRLSIIDIEGGVQPMSALDGQIRLSYNGEIYDYADRMSQQAAQGWSFKTRSDTETLIAGYVQEGPDFDTVLNGMYSYAMLDRRSGPGHIQIGLDPVGIKPLFIAETGQAILFASELRGMVAGLAALGVPLGVDDVAVSEYLTLGWVPAPNSLIKGVRRVHPGARMRISLPDSRGQSAHISTLAARPLPVAATSDEPLAQTLKDAIRRQVVADAPLGFFLSGGIDSSLLVSLASQAGIQPKTFTIRFTGGGHGVDKANEADVARAVADACGADHHELSVSAGMLADEFDNAFAAMDQPIADAACLPLLMMSRFARDTVKVCLSGDGGDELFLGYPRHKLVSAQAWWRSLPRPVQGVGRGVLNVLPTAPAQGFKEILRKVRVGGELVANPFYATGPFSGRFGRYLKNSVTLPDWAQNVAATNEAMFEADMLGQLSGQMLPKTDHVTMYASLEVRVPFLDLEMIAAARAMSVQEKRAGGVGKAPLRALLAQSLPPEITNRPKQGFRVPLTSWFRNELAADVKSRLLDHSNPATGAIAKSDVEALLQDHIAGNAEHSVRIWALLALQSWLDRLTADVVRT